jgi:hypothetical protein
MKADLKESLDTFSYTNQLETLYLTFIIRIRCPVYPETLKNQKQRMQ